MLICKTLSALELQEALEFPGAKPKYKAKGSKECFPPYSTSEKKFPLLSFFERRLKAEWEKPTSNKQFPAFVKRLYDLPTFANKMLQVLVVDAPIMTLQSPGLLSEDGQGSVQDNLDKRIDTAFKRTHEAVAMAFKASSTASLVSRAAIV